MTLAKLKEWLKGKGRQGGQERNRSVPAADGGGDVRPPCSPSGPSRRRDAGPSSSAGDDAASGRMDRRKAPSRRPVSRQGIPILKPDEDVWRHFLRANEGESDASPPNKRSTPPDSGDAPPAPPVDVATDRHGIPRLDDRVDLHRFFEDMVREEQEASHLGEIFRQSLQHGAPTLMKRKTGGVWEPRRLTLKEQLRRYPAPQAQIDLHGATALKARQRAESFIRTARADGLFTLRLIVGKGLHSEGGAVLPDVIEDLLLELKREALLLTYRWEKGVKRKSGAVIVYLEPAF